MQKAAHGGDIGGNEERVEASGAQLDHEVGQALEPVHPAAGHCEAIGPGRALVGAAHCGDPGA